MTRTTTTKRPTKTKSDNAAAAVEATGTFVTLGDPDASYSVDALSLSLDGKTLVAAGWFGGSELYAFKMAARPRAIEVKKPADAFHHIALSPDGSVLYGSSRSNITRTRIQGKGAALTPLEGASDITGEVVAIALRPDGAVLAAAIGDALVLWDTKSGEEIETRRGSPLSALSFGSDGQTIVGINQKGAVVILDAETRKRIAIVEIGDKSLRHLAISNDGDRVALASYSPKAPIRVFSIAQHKILFTLDQHEHGGIASLAFSRDADAAGARLASAGEDGHIRVWDVAKKKLIADVRGKQEAMGDVVFLDDGGRIAAGGRDTSNGPPIYVWEI